MVRGKEFDPMAGARTPSRQFWRALCGIAVICLLALSLSGCGSSDDAALRAESAEIADVARDAAVMVDQGLQHQLTPRMVRVQAQAIAKRFRQSLRRAIAMTKDESRFLAGNIAQLAIDGQQQALLIAGEPANDERNKLRRERLLAVATNAVALSKID